MTVVMASSIFPEELIPILCEGTQQVYSHIVQNLGLETLTTTTPAAILSIHFKEAEKYVKQSEKQKHYSSPANKDRNLRVWHKFYSSKTVCFRIVNFLAWMTY